MATLQEITTQLRGAVGEDSGLGKSLKFDFNGAGVIHIDGGAVTNDDLPADCTIQVSQADFEDLARGVAADSGAASAGGRPARAPPPRDQLIVVLTREDSVK